MNPPRKTCRGCGATKPLTDFKAHPRMRDGHLNYCRACTSGADSLAYTKRQAAKGKTHQPRRRYPPAPDGYKYCRHCHQLKPHAAFTLRPTTTNRDGLDSWCRACHAARTLATYHTKDPATRGVTQWANYHPQEASAARAHRRKLRPDITNAAHRRWIMRYPEKHATHHAVYRAIQQGLLTRPTTCEECGTPCKPTAHQTTGASGIAILAAP
jgi:hypothetical protein